MGTPNYPARDSLLVQRVRSLCRIIACKSKGHTFLRSGFGSAAPNNNDGHVFITLPASYTWDFHIILMMWILIICFLQCESLKAFEASRVWLKTCIFLIIILLIKLCILYFMYEMGMEAYGTIIYSMLELIFHASGLVVILRFFDEIKRNNPIASRIFYQSEENSSPKRNNVSDAVWF